MIRHIVLFSAKRPENVDRIVETLSGYAAIPGVVSLTVSRNLRLDPTSTEIDVVLEATFGSIEDLEAYKRHPIYRRGTSIVRPLRELRFVADTEIGARGSAAVAREAIDA